MCVVQTVVDLKSMLCSYRIMMKLNSMKHSMFKDSLNK